MHSLFKDINKVIYSVINIKFRNRSSPLGIRWNITERCSNNCVYCDVILKPEKDEALSAKEIKVIIDQIAPYIVYIVFSGGEPMLREDIGDIISYCRDSGIRWIELNSSGLHVKERIKELLPLTRLKLSVDGSEPVHDALRGDGSFSKIIEAADSAIKNGIKISFNTILTKNNLKDVPFLISLAGKYNSGISFEPLRGGERYESIRSMYPPFEEYRKTIDILIEYKKRGNNTIRNSFQGLEFIKKWPYFGNISCDAGKSFCIIRSDGSLFSCDHINSKNSPDKKIEKDIKILTIGFKESLFMLKEPACNGCGCEGSSRLSRIMNFDRGFIEDIYGKIVNL